MLAIDTMPLEYVLNGCICFLIGIWNVWFISELAQLSPWPCSSFPFQGNGCLYCQYVNFYLKVRAPLTTRNFFFIIYVFVGGKRIDMWWHFGWANVDKVCVFVMLAYMHLLHLIKYICRFYRNIRNEGQHDRLLTFFKIANLNAFFFLITTVFIAENYWSVFVHVYVGRVSVWVHKPSC